MSKNTVSQRPEPAYVSNIKLDLTQHFIIAINRTSSGQATRPLLRIYNKTQDTLTPLIPWIKTTEHPDPTIHYLNMTFVAMSLDVAREAFANTAPTFDNLSTLILQKKAFATTSYLTSSKGIADKRNERSSVINGALAARLSLQAPMQTPEKYEELANKVLLAEGLASLIPILAVEDITRRFVLQKIVLARKDELKAELPAMVETYPWLEHDLESQLKTTSRKKVWDATPKKYSLIGDIMADTLTQELMDSPAAVVAHSKGVSSTDLLLAHAKGIDMTLYAYHRLVKKWGHDQSARNLSTPIPVWFSLMLRAKCSLEDITEARTDLKKSSDLSNYATFREYGLDHSTGLKFTRQGVSAHYFTQVIKKGASIEQALEAQSKGLLNYMYVEILDQGLDYDFMVKASESGMLNRPFIAALKDKVPLSLIEEAHSRGVLTHSLSHIYANGITLTEYEQAREFTSWVSERVYLDMRKAMEHDIALQKLITTALKK